MELRRYFLILLAGLAAGPVLAGEIKRFPLDDRASYAVRISPEAPTTVLFPDKITALDGTNLSAKPDEAPVQFSHQPGANYFSVRALRPDARAAVNVLLRGRVFALVFTAGGDPDRTVTFYDSPSETAEASPSRSSRAARWLSLLDRAKNHETLSAQYPALAQQIERIAPLTTATADSLAVTTLEVFRFAAEDSMVLRLRLENHSAEPVRYATARLGIQIGQRLYPAAITDAGGEIPAGSAESIWLAITGEPDGRRANLALNNSFTVVVPRLP